MSPALLVLVLLVAHSSAALRDGAAALEPARQARAHVCSWAFVDACSREVQDWMRQSLETDATQLLPGVKQNALELLRPAPGAVVLDVGSGLGSDAQALAGVVGAGGKVIGVDLSLYMVKEAQARAAAAGRSNVDFVLGSAYNLTGQFPRAGFDAARVDRVLQHLADPERVIAEMAKIVKPGGRVMAVEPDWSTVVVDHPDARATQRVLQAMPALVAQPWVGRQLRRWFKAAGLTNIVVRPVAVVTMNPAAVALDTQVRALADDGVMYEEEVEEWLRGLHAMQEQRLFFYSITLYVVMGQRPSELPPPAAAPQPPAASAPTSSSHAVAAAVPPSAAAPDILVMQPRASGGAVAAEKPAEPVPAPMLDSTTY